MGGAPIAVDLRQEALDVAEREGGTVYNAADKDIVKKIKAGSDLGLGVYGVVDFVGGEKSFALSSSIKFSKILFIKFVSVFFLY